MKSNNNAERTTINIRNAGDVCKLSFVHLLKL